MRFALLCAANALCLLVLWRLFAPDLGSGAPADAVSAAPAGAPGAADVVDAAPGRARAPDPWLEGRVRKRIGAAIARAIDASKGKLDPSRVRVAVHASEVGLGDLVALEADRAMRPASNLKLVTSAAALVLLGSEGRIVTRFTTAGDLVDGRLQGDLVVRAAGDPFYDPGARGSVDAWTAALCDQLGARGLAAVDGALVLDEGGFAEPAPGPAWPAASEHWQEHCALAGGFSANAGCLTATVGAGSVGGPATVTIEPRAHGLPERTSVRTTAARSALRVAVGALQGAVRVEGTIPRDVPLWSARFAAPDPVDVLGNALAAALAARGIGLRDGWRRERRAADGERELATLSSAVADLLVPINTHSNNACADQLFLALGHAVEGAGTRAGGRAAVARALARLGVTDAGLVQVDGSGLSRDNRVSARQITALIGAVLRQDARTARLFVASLATASESGTLDDRMSSPALAGRVHAKTGFIGGTSALSGLIDAQSGRAIVFSILVEYPPIDGLNVSCWKPMQDAICVELAGYDE